VQRSGGLQQKVPAGIAIHHRVNTVVFWTFVSSPFKARFSVVL
jgi:hypothetical protein